MQEPALAALVSAFNRRDFVTAAAQASEGLLQAEGRDEIFWMGLGEACEGYRWLLEGKQDRAEKHFVAAMHNLRDFGYAYEGFQVTNLLAGLRRCAEEVRLVRAKHKRVFDITLLPQLKLAVREERSG